MSDQSELLRTGATANLIKPAKRRGGPRPRRPRRVPEQDVIYVGPPPASEKGAQGAQRPIATSVVPLVAASPATGSRPHYTNGLEG
jgi:hypothetical protein